ncbi:MAG: hypothetical protein ACYTEK_13005, partial [Planctomycetota bacterium]
QTSPKLHQNSICPSHIKTPSPVQSSPEIQRFSHDNWSIFWVTKEKGEENERKLLVLTVGRFCW